LTRIFCNLDQDALEPRYKLLNCRNHENENENKKQKVDEDEEEEEELTRGAPAASRARRRHEATNYGVLRFIFGLFQSSSDEVQDPMSRSCSTCCTDPCRTDLLNKHSPAQHATMQLKIKIAARLPRRKKTENRKQTNNCKNTLSSSGLPAVTMDLHFFLFRALQSQKNNLK
jgi:hypothetical protein